jgi:UDP-2-acetamido-3-amino-2,3-dideoxy-glucuronate N-acetyltransferase
MPYKESIKIEKEIVTGARPHRLENGSIIHRYSHVLPGATIGHSVMIGERCYVGSEVSIGHYSRIQNGNDLYDGLTIGTKVFIAPKVCISNHHDPQVRDGIFHYDPVWIKDGATIGIGSVIIAPCIIGEKAFVAGGAVVLRNIKDREVYYSLYKDKYASGLITPKGKKK